MIKNKLLPIILLSILTACSQKHKNSFENIAFKQGDLVFRKGAGAKSQAVLHADSLGIYSHIGIVVMKDSAFQVVHITPGERNDGEKVDRIKIEPISEFWRDDRAIHGAVYRLKENSPSEKAAEQALRLLKKGVLFDHDYQLCDTTEMYCTEFVWYSYSKAGLDISFGRRSVLNVPLYSGTYIFPSDIYTNSEFILIFSF